MSFETEAEVHLTIPSDELRNVRQQIEDSVGTTEVGVTDGGSMSAQAAGGGGRGGRARRRARREFRWARERTDHLEDAVTYLESIDDAVGDGGGGFGGMIGDVLGLGGGAAGGALAGGLSSAVATAAGAAVGTAVGDAISNETLSVEGDDLDVEKPDWTPITVDDPGDLSVDAPTLEVDAPTLDVDAPTLDVDNPSPLDVTDPSPLDVDDPSPLDIEEIDPLAIEEIDPIPVDAPDSIPVDVTVHSTRPTDGSSEGGGSEGTMVRAPSGSIGGEDGIVYDGPAVGTKDGEFVYEEGNLSIGGEDGVVFNTGSAGPPDSNGGQASTASRPAASTGTSTGTTTVTNQNDVALGDITIDPDLGRLRDEVLDETERMIDDAIDQLRREISR